MLVYENGYSAYDELLIERLITILWDHSQIIKNSLIVVDVER